MTDQLIEYIHQYMEYSPFIIFFALCLAGLNLPVSEDLMLFISAILASQRPDYLVPLFVAVYSGAYVSDLIAYGLGRVLGDQLEKFRFLKKMASPDKINKIKSFYDTYGMITLIIGRFIPFGVRNALFITAGISKMNFIKFALADLLAATMTTVSFFYLYHTYGESIIHLVKKANIVFAIIVFISILICWRVYKKKSS